MTQEAKLIEAEGGLVPDGDGWFVVNLRDARWSAVEEFGSFCSFEGEAKFSDLGINVHVLAPGQPACMYHREQAQEDFLVLHGECVVIIEEQERALVAGDFVHCPAETLHVFVGAGDGPCALVMVGARPQGEPPIHYPTSAVAARHGACAATATDNPREAYANRSPRRWIRSPWPLA